MDRVTLDRHTRNALMASYIREYLRHDDFSEDYNQEDLLKVYALFEHPAVSSITIKITEMEYDEDTRDDDERDFNLPETLTIKWTPKTSFKMTSQMEEILKGLVYVEGNKWRSRNSEMIAYSCEWEEVKDSRRVIFLFIRTGANVEVNAMTADAKDVIYEFLPDDVAGVLVNWFVIVQYGLYNRPTVVTEKREVTNIPARKSKYGKNKKRAKRIVEVVRHISFGEVEHKAGTHTMVCPAWGVCGHYRHYKDGKVVWVHPYKKGKMRNVAAEYEDKEYKFRKVEEGA